VYNIYLNVYSNGKKKFMIQWLPAGVIAGVVAVVLFTVPGQALKAAGSNPAEVVKSE
jgi:hypothetical protein